MTIPTLIQNHQRKVYVTQLHKVYNELQQSASMFMSDRFAVNLVEAGLYSQEDVDKFFSSYFNIVKRCDTFSECAYQLDQYVNINGSSNLDIKDDKITTYTLSSGVVLRPLYIYKNSNGQKNVLNILVDTNAVKGPNILGRDLFMMCMYIDGVIDDCSVKETAPLSKDERESLFEEHCMKTGTFGCFGKILNDNWEMTY